MPPICFFNRILMCGCFWQIRPRMQVCKPPQSCFLCCVWVQHKYIDQHLVAVAGADSPPDAGLCAAPAHAPGDGPAVQGVGRHGLRGAAGDSANRADVRPSLLHDGRSRGLCPFGCAVYAG